LAEAAISIKRVGLLSGALCAYWIGSGFSTGQEVLQFFSSSGVNGLFAALIFLAIVSPMTLTLFSVGYTRKFANPYDVFEHYCGRAVGQAYVWYSVALTYGVMVVMLAGAGATINQYFHAPVAAGIWLIGLLALGAALLGVERLIAIIGAIGPIKIAFMIVIGGAALYALVQQPGLLTQADQAMPTLGFKSASFHWAWSGALYALLTMIVAIPFMVSCGAAAGSLKEARVAAALACVGMTVAVMMLVVAELVYCNLIVGAQAPTLVIANEISPILGFVFTILIVLCIFSAVASFLLITVRKFAADRTPKFNAIATALAAIAIIFGNVLPFDRLVNILFPFAAYSAIVFAGFMAYGELLPKGRALLPPQGGRWPTKSVG
jgi:uncharacterized membrane protein YkvI